jgi:hypothetical protein
MWKAGRQPGKKEGRTDMEGREAGRKEGRTDMEGRKEGRQLKACRKERRIL